MRVIAGVLALVACSAASAEDIAPVFEIPLGQRLEKPFAKCNDSTRDRMDWCDKFGASSRLPNEIFIARPDRTTTKKIPTWITGGTAAVRLDADGRVASIMVSTVGPDQQAAVLDSVEARFGKPTTIDSRAAQNAYGASWKVTRATWDLPAAHIAHDCYRRDECVLIFETPEEHARRKAEQAAKKEKDRM